MKEKKKTTTEEIFNSQDLDKILDIVPEKQRKAYYKKIMNIITKNEVLDNLAFLQTNKLLIEHLKTMPIKPKGKNKHLIELFKKIGQEAFLDLVSKYGNYLELLSKKSDWTSLLNTTTMEALEHSLQNIIISNMSDEKYRLLRNTLPDNMRTTHPEMFLDKSAPEELQQYFYGLKKGERTIFLSPKLIFEHPDWLPFLENKALKYSFNQESQEFITLFGPKDFLTVSSVYRRKLSRQENQKLAVVLKNIIVELKDADIRQLFYDNKKVMELLISSPNQLQEILLEYNDEEKKLVIIRKNIGFCVELLKEGNPNFEFELAEEAFTKYTEINQGITPEMLYIFNDRDPKNYQNIETIIDAYLLHQATVDIRPIIANMQTVLVKRDKIADDYESILLYLRAIKAVKVKDENFKPTIKYALDILRSHLLNRRIENKHINEIFSKIISNNKSVKNFSAINRKDFIQEEISPVYASINPMLLTPKVQPEPVIETRSLDSEVLLLEQEVEILTLDEIPTKKIA